jgi:hypothetical protein
MAVYQTALVALLDLPQTLGSLQIEILNQPELLRKLEVIDWTPSVVLQFRLFTGKIDAFLNQVII